MPGPGETAGGTDWVKFRPPPPTRDCWGIFYTFSSLMKELFAPGCCYRQANSGFFLRSFKIDSLPYLITVAGMFMYSDCQIWTPRDDQSQVTGEGTQSRFTETSGRLLAGLALCGGSTCLSGS